MTACYHPGSKRILHLALGMCIAFLFCLPVHAQIYSDDQLLDYGIHSYDEGNYPRAAVFLFAFIQRQPDMMTQDQNFAKSVHEAYQYSQMRLDSKWQVAESPQQQPQLGTSRTTSGLTVQPPELKRPEKTQIKSYPLVVRGGGNLYFQYVPYSNFSHTPQLWITFERGGVSAGKDLANRYSLQSGQGAWLDRPVSASEPNRLLLQENIGQFTISWQNGRVMGVSSALPYLSVLQNPDQFAAFRVYNDGRGNFIVTQVE
jgi:hypothetical protein